jgi:hypothetical protein
MELEIFNRENGHASGNPTINMSAAGNVRIGKPAVKLMNLKVNDGLQLARNKADKQWYAVLSSEKGAFKLRAYKNDDSLQFNASAVTKLCFEDYEPNKGGASLTAMVSATPVNIDGVEYWPLLMKRKVVRP